MTETDPRRDYIRNAIVDALGVQSDRVSVEAVITDRVVSGHHTATLELMSRFFGRSGFCRRHTHLSMQ